MGMMGYASDFGQILSRFSASIEDGVETEDISELIE